MMTVSSMSKSAYLSFTMGNTSALTSSFDFQSMLGNSKSNGVTWGSWAFPAVGVDIISKHIAKRLSEEKETVESMQDFTKKSDKFFSEFFPEMEALKSSATKLQQTDFSSEDTEATVENVKAFAEDYNSALGFLNDNKRVSDNVRDLAASFAETKYNKQSYEAIGVQVDSSGKLSVDTEKLTAALQDDPSKVENLLGKNGLSKRAYSKALAAENNATNLVPLPSFGNASSSGKYGYMQGTLLDFYI